MGGVTKFHCKGVWMQRDVIHCVWEWGKEEYNEYSMACPKALKKLKLEETNRRSLWLMMNEKKFQEG